MVKLHFIDPSKESSLFATRMLEHVPRVGDELRFSEFIFFRVKRVVWCYDEGYERANVEIEPA